MNNLQANFSFTISLKDTNEVFFVDYKKIQNGMNPTKVLHCVEGISVTNYLTAWLLNF